jgi:Outer membrane protein beta-barrel domain
MKRFVALWVSVSMFALSTWAVDALAQYEPPKTPPPDTQREPPPADTLGVPGATTAKPPSPAAAPADTLTAAQRIRRSQSKQMTYVMSLGLGSSLNLDPDAFTDEYDPSFGLYLDGGVRRWKLELTLSFDYNFFFTNRPRPDDLNIFNLFLNLKYRPLKSTARPYVLGCAGWFRSWIVDPLDPNDPPDTFAPEVTSGDDNDYEENVLGYGVGGGVEVEIDNRRRIFLEGRYIEGQTRLTEGKENLVLIPIRLGLTWEF